jgi:hypothetical protein
LLQGQDFYDGIHPALIFFLMKISSQKACLLRLLSNFAVLFFVSKSKLFTMKKIIMMAAILAGCTLSANAQVTPVKPVAKANDIKTEKKAVPTKQVEVFKNTSANTAIAPLILPLPKNEVDTSFVPVVKQGKPKI